MRPKEAAVLALLALSPAGCAGFLESMAGSAAGNAAFHALKKHLTAPASASRVYELPAGRMIREVRSVLRARGLSARARSLEGEEAGTELLAERPLAPESADAEIRVIVKPLATSRSQVEVQVRSVKGGRSPEDDEKLAEELLQEVSRRVMWG